MFGGLPLSSKIIRYALICAVHFKFKSSLVLRTGAAFRKIKLEELVLVVNSAISVMMIKACDRNDGNNLPGSDLAALHHRTTHSR